MNLDKSILSFAGAMVLLSVALTYFFSPWWLLLTVFVGLNLFQAGITGLCPAALILKKCGVSPGQAFK